MTKEEFKKFAKEEFGYNIFFEKSDNPDTFKSLFGRGCKGCEHAPTTYEEYCLHTCCSDAYTDKATGCELFKKAKNCGVDQTEKNWYKCKKCAKELDAECIVDGCKFEPRQTEKSCRTCGYTKTSMPNYNDDRCKKCHYDGDCNTLWMPKQTEKSCETCKRHNLPIGAFGIDRIAYEYLICYECLKGSQNHYEAEKEQDNE